MSKSKARRMLERMAAEQRRSSAFDISELRWAAMCYWRGDIKQCAAVFFPLMEKLIKEPLKGTKEYEDGERKQEVQIEEQKETEGTGKTSSLTFDDLFNHENGDTPYAEEARDEDGYLIR